MQIISKQLINLKLTANDKEEAIRKISNSLDEADCLYNYNDYLANVLAREEITTTGIGFGIAIPHGKTNAVKQISVSFAHLVKPIEWQSLDHEKVDLIFQLAVPENSKGDEHLKLLSALSRKLIHPDFREQIRNSKTSEQIIDLIGNSLLDAVKG